MAWISLIFKTDAVHAELLSEALMEQGALSVDIHDAAANSHDEQPLFGEPGNPTGEIWQNSEVSALFNDSTNVSDIVAHLTRSNLINIPLDYRIEKIADQDWVRLTQSQFAPIQISTRMWIVPTWHTPPDPQAINHPTTQLCLHWLEQNLQAGNTVIDYGCGSGILAIAALKLGAAHITGIDIDEQAITVSQENAKRNQCNPAQCVFATSHQPSKPVDIVIANILANPLMILAPLLASLVKQGGHIALSGILYEQTAEVIDIYQVWFDMKSVRQQEDWVLLVGIKR